MQRCSVASCGHWNRPSARFCEKCGQPLREPGDLVAVAWSPLPVGHVLREGTYRIVEPLGKGGMGALYLAADTGAFGRRCVIKELLDYYDPTDPEGAQQAQERFETEARLLAELGHPGIPRIYSFFSEGGRHFIVMEYIQGETLERAVTHIDPMGRTVTARPLSAEEVIRHAIRICRVLEHLADQPTPIIHHDIKPANLIVDQASGEVRLVDFGTAESRTRWAAHARLEQDNAVLFGTRGYAAPEQYQAQSESRSDVYALAATVYHLLTDDDPGDHPFHFPELASLPVALADALARALRPEVQRRSTALEFRHALEAWLIPGEAAQPFVFVSGAVAHTTEELAAVCDKNWSEARQHLLDGDFDYWFRARNRHDLVAKAKSSRLEANPDLALEAFLRRLNPRLPPPKLVVEPLTLDFGRVTRGKPVLRRLKVHNKGRGYVHLSFNPSVPWLRFPQPEAGCLSGTETAVEVRLDAASLPLRREHQAVIACMPARGARISIGVTARLNLVDETFRRLGLALRAAGRLSVRGAKRGLALWTRTFRSLTRSRYGLWIVAGEAVILAVVMVGLWWAWRDPTPDLMDLARTFLPVLPLALLAVYLLPALAFVGGAVIWEMVGTVISRARVRRH